MADRRSDLPSLSSEEQDLAAGYVLGDLEAPERAEFEAKLSQSQALQAEVSQLQTSLHRLPLALEILTPSAFVGDRSWPPLPPLNHQSRLQPPELWIYLSPALICPNRLSRQRLHFIRALG
ncbi:MAG: hypothetical protein HC857_08785 [Synechococcales cyanobacterium RU_4_20]|nr:hypothetical protein [Synechococcales cyanobacterium RU_4_20]